MLTPSLVVAYSILGSTAILYPRLAGLSQGDSCTLRISSSTGANCQVSQGGLLWPSSSALNVLPEPNDFICCEDRCDAETKGGRPV